MLLYTRTYNICNSVKHNYSFQGYNFRYIFFQNDVCDVEDIEVAMTEGLGMWYAFFGPFQVEHLNADGEARGQRCITSYALIIQ